MLESFYVGTIKSLIHEYNSVQERPAWRISISRYFIDVWIIVQAFCKKVLPTLGAALHHQNLKSHPIMCCISDDKASHWLSNITKVLKICRFVFEMLNANVIKIQPFHFVDVGGGVVETARYSIYFQRYLKWTLFK